MSCDAASCIPDGYEIVRRYKWADEAHSAYVMDRDEPESRFQELFVLEKATGELFLWELEHETADPKNKDAVKKHSTFETSGILRQKDFAIIMMMPVYLIVKCARDFFAMLSGIVLDLKECRIGGVVKDIGRFIWSKMKDPFCAVAVMACALYGLIFPFDGRKQVAKVERVWHDVDAHRAEKERIINQDCKVVRNYTEDGVKKEVHCFTKDEEGVPRIISRNQYFLMAFCYQPHGNASDARYQVVGLDGKVITRV